VEQHGGTIGEPDARAHISLALNPGYLRMGPFAAVLGIALLAGLIWVGALLFRRLLRLDTASAVLLAIVLVPFILLGAGFLLSFLN
jgi:hypothetical protein